MSIVSVNNLTKIFGPEPQRALDLLAQGWSKKKIYEQTKHTVGVNRVSFDIEEGEIFVIMGLSGSGKSTLIRLLNRLIEPTSGDILYQNQNIVKMNAAELRSFRRRRMAMVFQKFALFPHRTILRNVEYGLEIRGVSAKKRQEKARSSLALVGLDGWENSYPDQLSGGMQQRVGLARALANEPDILLMDEAFSALDPLIRKDMQDELLDLQEKMKKTIIFITHDLNEALRIGDKIALLRDGSIVQIGTPEEILINPANRYVEKFVEDVDLSKVLTAAHVMRRPETIGPDRGPRVALQLMRDSGISNLYLVDKSRRLLGAISAEDASAAIKENKTLLAIATRDVPTVRPDLRLNELFDVVSATPIPVAVTDESNRLLGIIVRGAVLAALTGNAEHINVEGDADA
ncbi:quaternary amine ABC transporter ATP-binding protein [Cohnella thailandensis]|uniref:Quaternary amine transport ATP-binding protein n=1 Tax=Cohnella thailandensis TaxID=557557 RepID=A0A841T3C9_9BACL|nr:glycine betaine/L-proline ABC transporter ATP-binding protein [Cohnella thailandensis]MBB6636868.1 glycine betaine/L-proline ABC transporter ATP-binding protein [Cohnella thailandensis]MBP1973252.1 glycine betaine/proline transport system ATP-binding protein [Cohnella thailandensis]